MDQYVKTRDRNAIHQIANIATMKLAHIKADMNILTGRNNFVSVLFQTKEKYHERSIKSKSCERLSYLNEHCL